MSAKDKNQKQYTVYITDIPRFKDLRDRIQAVWYEKYGDTVAKGEILLKSLQFTLDTLNGTDIKGNLSKDSSEDVPISFKYSRIS